jgi:hypothetical protein
MGRKRSRLQEREKERKRERKKERKKGRKEGRKDERKKEHISSRTETIVDVDPISFDECNGVLKFLH